MDKDKSIHLFDDLSNEYGFHFCEISNRFIENQIPNNLKYLFKKTSHCDCGTVIGCTNYELKTKEIKHKDIIKLRKKNWSQSKIQRWYNDKKKNIIKTENKEKVNIESRYNEALIWYNFIKDIIETTEINQFGLLLLFYNKSPDNENFKVSAINKIPIGLVEPDYLMKITEDVLQIFI